MATTAQTFCDKYKPHKIANIIGNKERISNILEWVQQYSATTNTTSNTKPICFIYGSIGIGKTLLVELICTEFSYCPHYIQTIDEYTDFETLNSLTTMNPLLQKKNVIIVEEIDTMSDTQLKKIIDLAKTIKSRQIPIFCTSNEKYISALKNAGNLIEYFELKSPTCTEIYNFIYPIVRQNGLTKYNQTALMSLIESCNHDVRFILNTLQTEVGVGNSGSGKVEVVDIQKDNTNLNIFQIGREMFSVDNNFDRKYDAFWLEPSMQSLFVQENYINNNFQVKDGAKHLDNISTSAQACSNIDLLETCIHNTMNWDLQQHVAMQCIAATETCSSSHKIEFPRLLSYHRKEKDTNNTNNELTSYLSTWSENKTKQQNTNKVAVETKKALKVVKKDAKKITTKKKKILKDEAKEETKTNLEEKLKDNTNILLKSNDDMFSCECGAQIKRTSKAAHLKTKKHLNFMESKK